MQAMTYTVIGLAFLVLVITMQVRERRRTRRGLVMLPAAFVVLAPMVDHTAAHRLAEPLALVLLVAGVAVAAAVGFARATTMAVRRDGAAIVTRGTRRTVALWLVTIAVRVGMALLSYALGVPEGAAEGLFFAAATIATQNLVLARRAGLIGATRPAAVALERVG